MRETDAIEALRQVKEILDKYKVTYWLDAGALLGAVRDGKLHPWDHDIDLSSWLEDKEKIIDACKELRKKGFKIHFAENERGLGIFKDKKKIFFITLVMYEIKSGKATKKWLIHEKQYHYSKNGTKIRKLNILFVNFLRYIIWSLSNPKTVFDEPRMVPHFIHVALPKIFTHISFSWRTKIIKFLQLLGYKMGCRYVEIEVPIKYFTDLSTITFYGMEFRIPSPVEEYLEYRYGKDWRTPKKNWIFYKDDNSFHEISRIY